MTLQRISTTPYPLVTQQSDLDGVTYWFRFRWSERAQVWHMDLRTLNDEPIALSVALVTAWPLLRRSGQAPNAREPTSRWVHLVQPDDRSPSPRVLDRWKTHTPPRASVPTG